MTQLSLFDRPADAGEALPDFAAPVRTIAPDPAWLKLCRRQPALLELEREAAAGTDPGWLVPRLERLVGWYSKTPGLRARKWFDMAFDALGRAFALKRPLAGEAMEGRRK